MEVQMALETNDSRYWVCNSQFLESSKAKL